MVEFFREYHYDAIGLSSREVSYGFNQWQKAFADGLPVVAANVYSDAKGKKPLFRPYVIKQDHGHRLGVIGFVSQTTWRQNKDTTATRRLTFKSPFECGKLIRKVAKKSDHLTVIGEFAQAEAESLITMFPEIDVLVSSGIRSDQMKPFKKSVIAGVGTRGYNANFVDWNFATADSASRFTSKAQTLDGSVREDSVAVQIIARSKQPPAVSASQPPSHSGKP